MCYMGSTGVAPKTFGLQPEEKPILGQFGIFLR